MKHSVKAALVCRATFDGGRGRWWIGAWWSAAVRPRRADSSLLLGCFIVFIQRHTVLWVQETQPQRITWVLVHWRSFPVTGWRTESSVYLCDTYSGYPEVHGPSIVAAQVLDVLRLFLDLRMLWRQTQHIRTTQHTQLDLFHTLNLPHFQLLSKREWF